MANVRQINLYEPAILVVGTRGKSLGGFQGLLPGSVSKYCLQHSPVPVIVVRPSSKRDKARHKRANDPDRQSYSHMLAKSESLIEINSPRNSIFTGDEEATAVAAAIGYKQAVADPSPLAQVSHADYSDDEREIGTSTVADELRSPAVLMKSPELQNLDSPELSEESSSSDDEDQGGVSTDTAASGPNEPSQTENTSAGGTDGTAAPDAGAETEKQPGTFLNYG